MSQLNSVNLRNIERAFASKSGRELSRAYWLFSLMNQPMLTRGLSALLVLSVRLKLPVGRLVKCTIFSQFCGGESIRETLGVAERMRKSGVGTILDFAMEGGGIETDFEKAEAGTLETIRSSAATVKEVSLKITGIGSAEILQKVSDGIPLLAEQEQAWKRIGLRLDNICRAAQEHEMTLYIDAEESWMQPAIDELAEQMMKKYNGTEPVVITTLQMYRNDRLGYLQRIILDARRDGYIVGVKLVRGAYWEKEQDEAILNNRPIPVYLMKEETDNTFNEAVAMCLRNIQHTFLCAGTHNEESTLKMIEKMDELNIPKDHPHVTFSQLYGMSDHISYNLADAGYTTTKYLPFGPVRVVVPYLVRRAEENSAIAGQMNRELRMITAERRRRKFRNSGHHEQGVDFV